MILGIADAAGVVRVEAFGPRDGQRIGVDAVCLLASITKPIVTTAVLHEVETGRLDLAEPLSNELPDLAGADRQPFGAWHVLTHTSGMGDVDVEALLARGGDRAELLRLALAMPQDTPPGSTFRYASTTFELLAEALERRLDVTFEDLVRRNVLAPLGMGDTVWAPTAEQASRVAPITVDLPALAGVAARDLLAGYTRLRLSGGGLWSTAEDVLRFGRAMLRRGELDGLRVLSSAFVELATREVTIGGLGAATDIARSEHYAIGWGKPPIASPASSASFGHGGATGTRLWVDPAHDLVFLYLTGVWEMPHPPINAVQNAVYAALP